MKKVSISAVLVAAIALLVLPNGGQAQTLSQELKGRILLQVQDNGEAWYVYPENRLRYYLGRPFDAFQIMRELGLGISEDDYERFRFDPPQRLHGYILLRVQENGEAYYVDPIRKDLTFLGRPDDAFRIMREKGLGITTENLSHMPISGASIIPPGGIMNIIVDEPDWNQFIASPVTVSGDARVFENTVNIRVRNSNDRILANVFTTAQSPDVGQYGPFQRSVSFSSPGTSTGYVEAFNFSAKDGSEINKVISLVRF